MKLDVIRRSDLYQNLAADYYTLTADVPAVTVTFLPAQLAIGTNMVDPLQYVGQVRHLVEGIRSRDPSQKFHSMCFVQYD